MSDDTVSSNAETVRQEKPSGEPNRPVLQSIEVPEKKTSEDTAAVASPRLSNGANVFSRRQSLDLDDYFTGPRDMSRHSKWPMFLRMHGSILPKMIVPLLFVGAWSTAIVLISKKVHYLGTNSVLLTITGFIVSLSLSFRNATAYERYAEGRKYWGMLQMSSNALGRLFWIHAKDLEDVDPRESMLQKLNAMNLVVAFSIALRHTLRFEPFTAYPDIQYLIGHLNTFAQDATLNQPGNNRPRKKNFFKEVGQYLGVSFAASNPRKALKKTDRPLGNLPVEILNHLAMVGDEMMNANQIPIPALQTTFYNNVAMLNDILTGCERVLNTPLPLAYAIAISQITWVYVLLLPFQLIPLLNYISIPATVAASYIILGFLLIGEEIENPFGEDVNDLPLESYCEQIAADMDIIGSYEKRAGVSFLRNTNSMPLYPASTASVGTWMQRSEERLRTAIKNKPRRTFDMRRSRNEGKRVQSETPEPEHMV